MDLQKANGWKRIAAWLLDIMLLAVLAVGVGLGLSTMLGYDGYQQTVQSAYEKYAKEYGIDMELDQDDIDAMSEAAEELSAVDTDAINEAVLALKDAAGKLSDVDMTALNHAIEDLSGAATNLMDLDIEALNSLVTALETVAKKLEKTSNAISGIFGR